MPNIDRKRIKRIRDKRKQEALENKRKQENGERNLGYLIRQFYVAVYGKENVRFSQIGRSFAAYVNPEVDDRGPYSVDDPITTQHMVLTPLVEFDEELTMDNLLEIMAEDDTGERIRELAAHYSLMGGAEIDKNLSFP